MDVLNIFSAVKKSFFPLVKKSGKNILWLLNDYLILRKAKKVSLTEYSNFRLYERGSSFRENFLSYRQACIYWKILNPDSYANIARDKFLSHLLLERVGIPMPKLIAYYHPEIGVKEGLAGHHYEHIADIIKQSGIKRFVVKPSSDSAHGSGVTVCHNLIEKDGDLYVRKYDGEEIALKKLFGNVPMLIEELVEQTDQFKKFNSSSINTVRVMTCLYPDSSVKVMATFMKIGRNGSDVDNAGSGGNVDCVIDTITGETHGAKQFNSWDDIRKIKLHPDSGEKLNGVVIRNWDEIIESLKKYQTLIPQIKIIGWDVAVTDKGPVIIEINNWWDTTGQEFIDRGWAPEVRDCYEAWKHSLNR